MIVKIVFIIVYLFSVWGESGKTSGKLESAGLRLWC